MDETPASRRDALKAAAIAAAATGAGLAAAAAGAPTRALAVTEPAELLFDSDARLGTFTNLNTWAAGYGAGTARPRVRFGGRVYVMDAPINLRSGLRLKGTGGPAREFSTGTVFKHGGQQSAFRQVTNSQGYPSDGSARDVSVESIQFSGSSPVLPRYNPDVDSYRGHTEWYVDFRDCGFVCDNAIAVGWGDGLTFSGTTHVQACSSKSSPFWFGGSENVFGSNMSFLDSDNPTWIAGGLPFFNMFSTLWTLCDAMISARGSSYQLLVSGGGNGRVSRVYFDAPDQQPTTGAQLRVTGGNALTVSDCSFHNGGGILITGGSGNVSVNSCTFDNESGGIVVGSGFDGTLLLGLNAYCAGSPKTVRVARQDQVDPVRWDDTGTTGTSLLDPTVTVTVA